MKNPPRKPRAAGKRPHRHESTTSRRWPAWLAAKSSDREIAFRPARRVPDAGSEPASRRWSISRRCGRAMVDLGGDPNKINPLSPVDLVIDHSVQIDNFGNPLAFAANVKKEFERNGERYRFPALGAADAFENFRLVAARHRHLPSGQPRIFVAGGVGRLMKTAKTIALSRHAGRQPTATRRWSNGLFRCSAGASAASRPRAAMLGQPISMLIPEGRRGAPDRPHGGGGDPRT